MLIDEFRLFLDYYNIVFSAGEPESHTGVSEKNSGVIMKHILIIILVLSNLGFSQERTVIVKKVQTAVNSEKARDVNVTVNNDLVTVKVSSDGKEQVFEVDCKNPEALKGLIDKLKDMDVNIDLAQITGPDAMICKSAAQGGWLGVKISDLTDQLREYFSVSGAGGVLITEVVDKSPALISGLLAGDVIVQVNDQRIGNTSELQRIIRKSGPAATIQIKIIRKGREKTVTAVLDEARDAGNEFFNEDGFKFLFKNRSAGDDDPNCRQFDYQMLKTPNLPDMGNCKKDIEDLRQELEKLRQEMKTLHKQ